MKNQEDLEELERNALRIRTLIEIYDKTLVDDVKNEEELHIQKLKAEYLKKEILKATSMNDKILRKIE
ncbi:MAG: hypothetical protein Q8O89_04650 [Nanoarchaeota archaeon]|nr:hypothetical protein [Nanoarchaeota archaeon]